MPLTLKDLCDHKPVTINRFEMMENITCGREDAAACSIADGDAVGVEVKIQEYLFHGSEEGDTSEYEPSEPLTSQKRKMNAKAPLPSDHLKKKQNLHLPKIPQPA
ncbi:hypothetical protein NPIL_488881 [Nephila pilipes]|uniref:Uncharacterized protein n=1 Tax=Nephila pilipes TaxID=299642 RepID=A0A8X6N5B7_NEPPI|nr:hypothetical protein NPIL_488881 [Nephila pilipes]